MKLYHYTSKAAFRRILSSGIKYGEVPVNAAITLDYPWLTSSPVFIDQKWADEDPHKTEVKLHVDIPGIDDCLNKWPELAKELLLTPLQYSAINCDCDPSHWYVYLGIIPAEWVTHVTYRKGSKYLIEG